MLSLHLAVLITSISSFSASTCDFDVSIGQHLLNEGFHRNLTYKVIFSSDSSSTQNCYIGLDQTLPAGVYANPDELGDLRRLKKLTAIPRNRVNVELPAEQSQPTNVFIIRKIGDIEESLWLPVHARYHQAAKGGGYVHNTIEPPRLYLRCPDHTLDCGDSPIKFLCNGHSKDQCAWDEIPVQMLTSPPTLSVPVGNTDDTAIVALATLAVTVIGSLYLLKTLHEYKLNTVRKGK